MKYEFAGSLYRTESDMYDAIVDNYMTAGGGNDRDFIKDYMRQSTDAALTAEVQQEWEFEDFDVRECEAAFSRFRASEANKPSA